MKSLKTIYGYEVMISPRTMRKVGKKYYSMRNDYFSLFDICAKKGSLTRWIQVKSHISDYYRARKDIAGFEKNCCVHEILEFWVRENKRNRVTWRIICYDPHLKDWQTMLVLNNNFENI